MITDADRTRKADALDFAVSILAARPDASIPVLAEAIATIGAHRDLLRYAVAHPEPSRAPPRGQLALL